MEALGSCYDLASCKVGFPEQNRMVWGPSLLYSEFRVIQSPSPYIILDRLTGPCLGVIPFCNSLFPVPSIFPVLDRNSSTPSESDPSVSRPPTRWRSASANQNAVGARKDFVLAELMEDEKQLEARQPGVQEVALSREAPTALLEKN